MCRNDRTFRPLGEGGFSLVPALFLLVVLAGLGVVAVRLTAVQSQTVVLGMQSARAYAAASSGVEWAAYRALVGGSCDASSLTLTEAGLSGFTVDTTCSSSTHTEGTTTVRVYVIDAFARSGIYGTPDYVSRRLRATLTDAS
jgi:MSHA biogenesis protein MshP